MFVACVKSTKLTIINSGQCRQNHILSMDKIYTGCPRGHYLSDGAYKEVFKVFSAHHKRLEAVSVMDIRAIESTGNQV
jgi:hypothetical protein